jgi:hypothetical protein
MLPVAGGAGGAAQYESIKGAGVTVEAIGTGAAPAQCRSGVVFGAAANSDRWLQVRTPDQVLWTIGLGGLGNAPMVATGDHLTFDLEFYGASVGGGGYVQLSDAAGTPLVWAGSTTFGLTWLSLTRGGPVCGIANGSGCSFRYDVAVTLNGTVATAAPFSAMSIGGYDLAVGEYDDGMATTSSGCGYPAFPLFAAAAVKAQ